MLERKTEEPHDVVIAGSGIAGLAVGILLEHAGKRVVCIEPERFPRSRTERSWLKPDRFSGIA